MGILPDIYRDYVTAAPDIEKIQMLLDNMDPATNSQAYQTLYNLSMIEPMRVNVDNAIQNPMGMLSVSTKGINKKVPYFTINFTVMTGKAGPGAMANRNVKVYIHDLEDKYSDEVKDTMDTLDISVDEIEEILGEHGLTKTYEEYESMSEQEKANYDALAWLATMAILPDDIPVPGTYTLPVGLGITITYSVSAKGTITDGEISTTIEMQKKELKSLTYSKDNADLIITEDGVAVGAKSEVEGLDSKISGGVEMSLDELAISTSIEVGQSITSVKTNVGADGSTSISYSVETKVNESASVSSELELKKEKTNDDLPGWKPVGIPIFENLPEPFELPIGLPGQLPLPIPAF